MRAITAMAVILLVLLGIQSWLMLPPRSVPRGSIVTSDALWMVRMTMCNLSKDLDQLVIQSYLPLVRSF